MERLSVGPTIKSLLAPSGPSVTLSQGGSNNGAFSNKMLRDPSASLNTVQNSGTTGGDGGAGLHNDPTLLALKAYALRKAQSIQQPNVVLNQKKQQEESSSDFKPIPVDLSAILSPAPPLEVKKIIYFLSIKNQLSVFTAKYLLNPVK